MCGGWDGNPSNDFKDREGNQVGSPNTMGEAFRVSNNDDGCPAPPEPVDPCDEVSRAERNWAEQYCSRYKQEPFKSCPVDVTQAFAVSVLGVFRVLKVFVVFCCIRYWMGRQLIYFQKRMH